MKVKKSLKNLFVCAVIAVCSVLFFYWQNNGILSTYLNYSSAKLPSEFDGFKILQISDLHNKEFGKNQTVLMEKIKEASPDIIVITGDMLDYYDTRVDIALSFAGQAVQVAPVYYVSGNHELETGVYSSFSKSLREAGVTVLDNQSATIQKNDASFTLIGLQDISFLGLKNNTARFSAFEQSLANLKASSAGFTVLLSHRPEYMELYKSQHIDLVFSGHAHGGQIRLPLIGGLYAPGQGIFPKYTSGSYSEDSTTMIVSQGLGSSVFPLRIFNRPQVLTVTLHAEA